MSLFSGLWALELGPSRALEQGLGTVGPRGPRALVTVYSGPSRAHGPVTVYSGPSRAHGPEQAHRAREQGLLAHSSVNARPSNVGGFPRPRCRTFARPS